MNFKNFFLIFLIGIAIPIFEIEAESIIINDEVVLHPSSKVNQFNTFEDDNFRFDYSSNFSVKKWKDFIFLEENNSQTIVWAIFEPNNDIRYKINDFSCFSHLKKGEELCVFDLEKPNFIKNLIIFPKTKTYEQQKIKIFQEKGFLKNYNPNGFFSRGSMVALALKLKYPDKDFSEYAERCFLDVSVHHPYSGEICWAKAHGIVIGIGKNFYPESSINVWGILKILGFVFNQEWPTPDMEKIPKSFMTKLHKYHIATEMLQSAYQYGILKNIEDQSLWPNRSVRQKEVIQIVADFLSWKNGKVIKSWKLKNYTPPISKIFYKQNYNFEWKEKKKLKNKYRKDERNIVLENIGNFTQVWLENKKGFFVSTGQFPIKKEKISKLTAWFDFEKWEGEIEVIYKSGLIKIFRPKIKKTQFEVDSASSKNIKNTIKFLEKHKRSPRLVTIPDNTRIPIFDIEMSSSDFEHFFNNTTRNTRYPASLKMVYPNGKKEIYSIVLKARGNANRGYIKPSLTIESFQDFTENKMYHGDEFLEKNKEIKLRSFINEETMIHEKLFYKSTKELGHPAPDFFETLVRINGVPFGLFQVTEPIKKDFFKKRNISTTDYFYAQNINAEFDTDLGYYDTDEKTLSAYKIKGDKSLLLELIKSIDNDDSQILSKIDIQSVFDYTALIYLSNAWDSLTHNYYIFWNKDTEKWGIFPWDADLSWENIPQNINLEELETFAKNKNGSYNKLINYVFENLSKTERENLWQKFNDKFTKKIHLQEWAEEYRTNYQKYFQYDNRLWNGRFLERKKSVFDTNIAILKLKKELEKLKH